MIDPTDFCPGCGRLNGCACEQDEAESNAEIAAEAVKTLEELIVPDNMTPDHCAAFEKAIEDAVAILYEYT